MAINSNCDRISGGCGSGSPEETWLRNDLAAHPTECTIAMWHHARYSSGHDGDNTFMQTMWSDLFDAGVEIVLSGHSHDYERFAPQDDSGHLDNAAGSASSWSGPAARSSPASGTRSTPTAKPIRTPPSGC